MRKAVMTVLTISLLATQVLYVFGKLTILRGSDNGYSRKLVCLSEDDGGALVWNSNLLWKYTSYSFTDRKGDMKFRNLNAADATRIDCTMSSREGCLELWTGSDWSLTDSFKMPMGPVSDQRWEGKGFGPEFKEYVNFDNRFDYVKFDNTTAAALSFSVRTSANMHILLCNNDSYKIDSCYWVILGGWANTKSVVRKCINGVPETYPKSSSECAKSQVSFNHTSKPLSATEWRSFVITWNSVTRNISVYDTGNVIVTYVDTEKREYPSVNFRLFIRSSEPMLYRFHIYDFLHTTVENAILTSPVYLPDNTLICVQLLIGLCAECDASVMLLSSDNDQVLETLTVKGSSVAAIHGLPMWQYVKITKTRWTVDYGTVKIQLIPKLNSFSSNPIWAIANVRQCPPNGTLRAGIMKATSDYDGELRSNKYYWPTVTCQRLLYHKHAIVNSVLNVTLDVELDDPDCPAGKIGPQCLYWCREYELFSNSDCRETSICYENGCTCPPGFFGSGCSQYCDSNSYGHYCKETCGRCLGSCNRINGKCSNGCNNERRFYVPPLCQIGIDKPDTPNVNFVNETSIQVSLPVKDEYKKTEIFYTFSIRNDDEIRTQPSREIFQNTTSLIGYFENLQPGTTYDIICRLYLMQSTIETNWKSVQTHCNAAEGFEVTYGETNFTIDWRINANQLHLCPVTWYSLVVHDITQDEQIANRSIQYFPCKVVDLTPYTSFNVTVFLGNRYLYSREIRTLEGVPSSVIGLRSMLTSNTEVALIWNPPKRKNGEIVRYEVTLKVEEYNGCRDLKLPTPKDHIITKSTTNTIIKIADLHPYTYYSASVTAHNSRHGSANSITPFETNRSEIPTAIFSNLRMEGWKLLWSQPEDCTKILGPIYTRIKIRGISSDVKEFEDTINTRYNYVDLSKIKELYGAEQYLVKAYVIRYYDSPENAFAYVERLIDIPAKAPPQVTNLDVIEIDTRETPFTIHLRWQSPSRPLNGELDYYAILSCKKIDWHCRNITVKLNKFCDLWDGYICGDVQEASLYYMEINVVAYNKNVSEPSLAASVTDEMLSNTIPDAPENYTVTINDNSIVDLKWLHPWRTGSHLRHFRICVNEISSNLRRRVSRSASSKIYEHPVTDYARNYSERLYLLPSTRYVISIQAVTIANKNGIKVERTVRTPSTIDFNGDLKVLVQDSSSVISLFIPDVLNDTRDSVLYVIVKGPSPCERYAEVSGNLRALADVRMYDIAWQAAVLPTSQFAGKVFMLGDDRIYGGARNCPLRSEESYEIAVLLSERDESIDGFSVMLTRKMSIRINHVPSKHYEAWLIPIILFVVVVAAAFYFYRRKRENSMKQLMLQEEIGLSQAVDKYESETKSAINSDNASTSSNKEFLSRASTPEKSLIIEKDSDEGKEVTSLVKVKDFEDYVREAIQSGLLDEQYETFARGQTRPWDYGKLPQNKPKNRYGNLIAYDETRVKLKKLPEDAYSDYINANYITGYKKEKRYIATQGPKPNTVIDFWRMIWQENVLIICMLANTVENGKTKCEQYWPDIGKKKKYGDVIVHNAKHNVFADYCFRSLQLTCGEETRKVEHLHYTAWPDHGVPLYTHSVVTYLKKLLATPPGNGPVVVHCSAGVGRTGTIILCDICLHRAAAEGVVDVFAETASIRSERANMVDNRQQYLLAHLALVECLLSIPTTLTCNDTLPVRIKELKKLLTLQQQRLQDTAWQNDALRQVTSHLSLSERNRAKNRFPELISDKISRIYLKRYPASDEDSDYISAVYVDGVRLQNQYVATQLPMPSTINDFWRMVAEFKVEVILMVQPPDPDDPTCCAIAPASGEFKPTPYLNVIAREIVETEYYTTQRLLLADNSEKPTREQSVTILCSTKWKPGRNQALPPVVAMVTLWQAAERITRGDGLAITLCHDGVTGCGLYLALSFLLERMAVERECDVCLAVRAVRRSRPDFVQSLEFLEYLYDAAVMYLEYFETYANFS